MKIASMAAQKLLRRNPNPQAALPCPFIATTSESASSSSPLLLRRSSSCTTRKRTNNSSHNKASASDKEVMMILRLPLPLLAILVLTSSPLSVVASSPPKQWLPRQQKLQPQSQRSSTLSSEQQKNTPLMFDSANTRGGYQQPPSSYMDNKQPQQANYEQQQYSNQGGFDPYEPPPEEFHQYQDSWGDMPSAQAPSEQERIDAWRQSQRELQAENKHAYSLRDSQGRMKLLTPLSKSARALLFFIMMWRDVHLFEVADQLATYARSQNLPNSGLVRLIRVVPLVSLFVGNLAGCVCSFTAPSHSSKTRLKTILNANKLLEVLLMVWYLGRLTVFPGNANSALYVPREIYIAGTLHSVLFLLQCQAYTKLSWEEERVTGPSPQQAAILALHEQAQRQREEQEQAQQYQYQR